LVLLASCGIPHTQNQRAGIIQTLGSFRYTKSSSVVYNFCCVKKRCLGESTWNQASCAQEDFCSVLMVTLFVNLHN
jgi:hypothetical protein